MRLKQYMPVTKPLGDAIRRGLKKLVYTTNMKITTTREHLQKNIIDKN